MNTEKILASLCTAFGGSGSESGVNGAIKALLPDRKTACDAMGNLAVELVARKADRPVVMLTAHTDEISFIVNEVKEDGTLLLATVGGIDRRVLYGADIVVHTCTGDFEGVICSGENDVCAADSIIADIGYSKLNSPVSQGDRAGFLSPFTDMGGGVFLSRSLDNRVGCAVLIKAAESISTALDFGVYLMFAVQEEIGTRGAGAGTVNIHPDIAVGVDVSFGNAPDVDCAHTGKSGEGAMIGVSPVLSDAVTKELIDTAKSRKIPYQVEIMGGSTGTDCDKIAFSGGGVATGLVSVPIRSMHTPSETVLISDVNSAARLLAAYVNRMGGVV